MNWRETFGHICPTYFTTLVDNVLANFFIFTIKIIFSLTPFITFILPLCLLSLIISFRITTTFSYHDLTITAIYPYELLINALAKQIILKVVHDAFGFVISSFSNIPP